MNGVNMLAREGRPYFRTKDEVYYGYELIEENPLFSNLTANPVSSVNSANSNADSFFTHESSKEFEVIQSLKNLDGQLLKLSASLTNEHPVLGQYLHLLNTKVDHLLNHLLGNANSHFRKVNISLNGMSFKTEKRIKEKTLMKLVIYTKPNLFPLVVKARVIYSQFHMKNHYHTAVEFESLTGEQEELLSHHIKLALLSRSI